MRPVEKYRIGAIVQLEDGSCVTIKKQYNPYRDALSLLTNNFGTYCLYCENSLHNCSLNNVEHIKDQSKHPGIKFYWGNFLLSCTTCNGRKSYKELKLYKIHMPHRNNTFKSFIYKAAGVVEVNPALTGNSYQNAQNLFKLIGYDELPKHGKDGRIEMRRVTWDKAIDFLNDYEKKETNLKYLIDYAKAQGGWSIWFTVFKDHPEVRKALIDEFPGTAKNCFDASNNFEPINRNPYETDPI